MKTILLMSLSIFSIVSCGSDDSITTGTLDEFSEKVRDEIAELENRVESSSNTYSRDNDNGSKTSWFLKTFRVRIRPKLSVGIPGIAKSKIQPEVELYFTRTKL
jgi:hypothetical protein